ncbi:MAG: hypothetical protein PVS2B2_26110 [Candidatus Acidiferrum sp.]
MAIGAVPDSKNLEGGNKNVFGGPTPVSSRSREQSIVDRTKALAFPSDGILSLENFEHGGDRPAGWENSIADMQTLTGKELQESYRQGVANQRGMTSYTDKVTDR